VSHVRKLIKRAFLFEVSKSNCSSDLKASLKDPKNMNRYLDHWTAEVLKANFSRKLKKGGEYKGSVIEDTVKELTQNLISICEKKAQDRLESYLSKKAKEAEASRLKDLEKSVDGELSGDYEAAVKEGGVLIGDTKEVIDGKESSKEISGKTNELQA
jgi:hypothetical protein